jgi:glycosyltransferase involved in cell wall biosynthesis
MVNSNGMESPPQDTAHVLEPRGAPALLSLVLPCYNEAPALPFVRQEISMFLDRLAYPAEVILVDDGSSDATFRVLWEWAQTDPRIKVLHLSRNFGHQVAATAGLDHAAGDAVVLMDADLQDPLDVIPRMVERYREGYDVVYGRRSRRKDETATKRFTAWLFYRLMRLLVYKDLPVDVGDFRLISRPCLNALCQMREQHRFLRGMVTWAGFPQIDVEYEREPRRAGETKYPMWKMLKFAWTAATSFSVLPLNLSFLVGGIIGLFGLEEACRALLAHFMHWYTVPGWTSLMVVNSLIGSALLIFFGVLGQYIGRIYEQSKGRPLYFVARAVNCTPENSAATTQRSASTARHR